MRTTNAFVEQVETLLKTQDTTDPSKDAPRQDSASAYVASTEQQTLPNQNDYLNTSTRLTNSVPETTPGLETTQNGGSTTSSGEPEFPWEMIGLGLEEPLPPQEVMEEL